MATSQEQWNTDEKLSNNSLILSHVMSKRKRNPKWEAFKEQASIKRQGKKEDSKKQYYITVQCLFVDRQGKMARVRMNRTTNYGSFGM